MPSKSVLVIAGVLAALGAHAPLRASPGGAARPALASPALKRDPTQARYFADFNRAPPPRGSAGDDLRLNDAELSRFRQSGFVVSERLGAPSFGHLFYKLFRRDLPVYVSADAVLHAWHYSYDAVLKELEQTYLVTSMNQILEGMAQAVPAAQAAYGPGPLQQGLQDAELYLAVARSLLRERTQPTTLAPAAEVERLRGLCEREQPQPITLFGEGRDFDFSQCKPRGHYEYGALRAYFRAMIWLGQVQMTIGGDQRKPRQLGAAVVLWDLLRRSGQEPRLRDLDRLLRVFVGLSDSAGFTELGALLERAGLLPLTQLDDGGLQRLWEVVTRSQPAPRYGSARAPEFRFLGQRFLIDAWVAEEVTGERRAPDGATMRRLLPTGLDIAYAALGNDAALPLLAPELAGHGALYRRQLSGARRIVDAGAEPLWGASLYAGWLHALRALSLPQRSDPRLPEAMRTAAWSHRLLNTQLASWAQARHDTLLYAKQSQTHVLCEYPAGFVEPVPLFWGRLAELARRGAGLLRDSRFPEVLRAQQGRQVTFLEAFASTTARLQGIAQKELEQRPLSGAESQFLKDLIQINRVPNGCTVEERYTGWYPSLFYLEPPAAGKPAALVADVHTGNDNGSVQVLHAAVGDADLMLIAVDSGKDHMAYAGPVFSYHELPRPGATRLNDSEWRRLLRERRGLPQRPAWTGSFLVPRP